MHIPREDSYNSLQKCYNSVRFEVTQNDDTRYDVGDEICRLKVGPVALFSETKLATNSDKLLQEFKNLQKASLMYKLLSSVFGPIELFHGFFWKKKRKKTN